jgi:hypothetical protein
VCIEDQHRHGADSLDEFEDCHSEPAVPCGVQLLAQLSEAGDGVRGNLFELQ